MRRALLALAATSVVVTACPETSGRPREASPASRGHLEASPYFGLRDAPSRPKRPKDATVPEPDVQRSARSSSSSDRQLNGDSDWASLSADARYVAFWSEATNAVARDTNRVSDVFVHDRKTGRTERVSVSSSGRQADRMSYAPAISATGRHVAFLSDATNLVPGDSNRKTDLFAHDRRTRRTTRIGEAYDLSQPRISADGRFVAFQTPNWKIALHDRTERRTTILTTRPAARRAGQSMAPGISPDGRYVVYQFVNHGIRPCEPTELPPPIGPERECGEDNDCGGPRYEHCELILLYDRIKGESSRIAVSFQGEGPHTIGDKNTTSENGRFIGFSKDDSRGRGQLLVQDRETGERVTASVSPTGANGDDHSLDPALSADGRFLAFTSDASNLVRGDRQTCREPATGLRYNCRDAFVRNLVTGKTTLVSVSSSERQAAGGSGGVSISSDGRLIAFGSEASNLVAGDTNGVGDVFVRDVFWGTTQRVSVGSRRG